jgi:hypothetical protein
MAMTRVHYIRANQVLYRRIWDTPVTSSSGYITLFLYAPGSNGNKQVV